MRYFENLIVIVLLAGAMYTDRKEGKIKNSSLLVGLGSGLLLSYLENGTQGFLESITAAGIMLAALFFLYLIKGMGAGDIKLLCVLAAFFPEEGISIVTASFFTGAAMVVGRMVCRWVKKEIVFIKHETMKFSIPITIGTGIVFVVRYLEQM